MAAPRWRVKTLAKLAARRRPARVVDLGCGDGSLLASLRERWQDAALFGVDFAPAQIESNRRREPTMEWAVADLESDEPILPQWQGGFDVVIASEIVEHLEHPERLLKHAWNLARPGGMLLLSTQSGRVHETEKRVGHRRHFSLSEMDILLREAGWMPVRLWNAGFPFHDWSKAAANLSPGRALREFGQKPYGFFQRFVCFVLRVLFLFNSADRGAQLFALAEKR